MTSTITSAGRSPPAASRERHPRRNRIVVFIIVAASHHSPTTAKTANDKRATVGSTLKQTPRKGHAEGTTHRLARELFLKSVAEFIPGRLAGRLSLLRAEHGGELFIRLALVRYLHRPLFPNKNNWFGELRSVQAY